MEPASLGLVVATCSKLSQDVALQDFFQLLRPDLSLLRLPKKDMDKTRLFGGLRLYTSLDFEDEFGIRPDQASL